MNFCNPSCDPNGNCNNDNSTNRLNPLSVTTNNGPIAFACGGTAMQKRQQDSADGTSSSSSTSPFASMLRLRQGYTYQLAQAVERNDPVVESITDSQIPSAKEMDSLVAQELNELSSNERDELLHDLHGVGKTSNEETINDLVLELQNELSKKNNKNINSAYNLALNQNPSYVNDPEFHKMFLRAEKYNVTLAAHRILYHYFEEKQKLFGSEKLTKEITMNDLSETDLQTIQSGYFQTIQDSAQRSVIILCGQFRTCDNVQSLARVSWLQSTYIAKRGVQSQKQGCVAVLFNVGPKLLMNRHWLSKVTSMRYAYPVRCVSIHYCLDQPSVRKIVSTIRLMAGKQMRARFRVHEGSFMECKYALQGFGINSQDFPISDSGELISSKPYPTWFMHYCDLAKNDQYIITENNNNNNNNNNNENVKYSEKSNKVDSYDDVVEITDATKHQADVTDNNDVNCNKDDNVVAICNKEKKKMNNSNKKNNGDNEKEENNNDNDNNNNDDNGDDNDDQIDNNDILILKPGPFDVPFGRGSGARSYTGYKRFQIILENHRETYEAANRYRKTEIAESIVRQIKSSGGVFLKQNNNVSDKNSGWNVVDDDVARAKVSHAFRAKRRLSANEKLKKKK